MIVFRGNPVIPFSIKLSRMTAAVIIIGSCASKGPVTGGPVDEVPPRIVETFPEQQSLNIGRILKVVLKFSENMNRGSVVNSIFISPTPKIDPAFNWKGYKKLEIRFMEKLEEDRTYVVSIGSGAMDAHKNNFEKTFTLAFSTGDYIENGSITGKVYGEFKYEKILIFAYLMEDSSNLNPDTLRPDYTTQLTKEGLFRFNFLSNGRYRLFAIEDNDRNLQFDIGKDRISISPLSDLRISDNDSSSYTSFYKFFTIDTLNPRVLTVFPRDNSHMTFRALEPLVYPTSADSIWISDSTGENKSYPQLIYPDAENKNVTHLHFAEQNSDENFYLYLGAFKDSSGNSMDSSSVIRTFTTSANIDTAAPRLLSVEKEHSFKLLYLNDKLNIKFSEAISEESKSSAITILDSDSEYVQYGLKSVYPNLWEVHTEEGWKSNEVYSLHVNLGELKDLKGNPAADSVWTMKFRTVNTDTFGIIIGKVLRDAKSNAPLYITASTLKIRGRQVTAKVSEEGSFRIENVLPGIYFLSVYEDKDNNGKFSKGQLAPYQTAELYYRSPDTVRVRARWETSDHIIDFRRRQDE